MNAALNYLLENRFKRVDAPGDDEVARTFLFFRIWPGYLDLLHLRAEDDVTAIRSLAGRDDRLFDDRNVVWRAEGPLVGVVGELRQVPAPGLPGAPSRPFTAPSHLCVPAASGFRERWCGRPAVRQSRRWR
ncbi:hypothetical protein [Goodfellowiella coeruleoviolacea]|uniref:hypothetical protein n=1 Tax=Goodfellowiella coeruleoviolacea TaxID=334858 RepID=UPI0020A482BD|nr:hypothetical protein [Goodfellowiella coeruleoviolacea]